MAKHIAFFNIPAVGHVYPTLAVVTELCRRGHRVTYTTIDKRAATIEATGATALTYQSLRPSDCEANIPPPKRTGYITQTLWNFLLEAETALDQLAPVYEHDPIDLVVYDRIAFAGRIVAASASLPTIQLWPMLVSNEHWSMGAGTDAFDPTDPVFLAYWERLTALLDRHHIAMDPADFLAPASEREIGFYPRAYQYHGELFDDRYCFVGPCIREPVGLPRWTPPPGDHPILLVTLGTIYNEHPDFYRACIAAFADTPWHVVMAIGERIPPHSLGPVPPNVEVHQVVHQLDVLKHAKVLLSHGGVGGIMEAMTYGVPVLAAPQTLEQETNAARIEELNIGARIPSDGLSPTALRHAVELLAKDESVAQRVEWMRGEIATAGGPSRAADVIEAGL